MKAFSGASTKISTAGADMITGLIKGMESKTASETIVADKLVTTVVKKITDKQKSFYEAGSHLVTEFKNGISDNSYKAAAKATAMAEAAVTAARTALRINSPSKVFRGIGYSVPEGFAMGIDRLGYLVTDSSRSMADEAVSSVRSSIARVADVLNTDIDAQPTIRPVVDLSAVSAGTDAINGMFGFTPSIGVLSNVRAINSMMNRNQNGNNKDVVSAIKDLEDVIGKNSGNSYTINGVTYSEGSDVSDAVKTLVRAVTVGRRK
jgi:hypothetical protein